MPYRSGARTSSWAPQIERAAAGVARIRAAGYPTPAWLAVGTSADGFGYQIQEFARGHTRPQVTVSEARLLIGVLEMHAGLDPDPQRCWSEFVTARMAGEDLWRQTAGTGPTGRDLVHACERLLAAHGPVTLPIEDLVHGDFRPGNILFDADRVSGVVDIEALGSGTRVFDYATLLSAHDFSVLLRGTPGDPREESHPVVAMRSIAAATGAERTQETGPQRPARNVRC
ncbi:phosphotransferase, partial [Streptomyces sp. NPDC057889]|uniref:phosphotransferase n=1 Tax=unclassified Streptomyces TaxID=2593676 RepID=UPI0036821264